MLDLSDFTLLKQGAEARLYTGLFLGQKVIVKERFVKTYRHPVLDESLRRDRLKGEVRALIRCKSIGISTPTVLLADLDSALIVMENMDGCVTAKDFIDQQMKTGCQETLMLLSSKIGETLGKMHKAGIIHGDLTTSNMLIDARNGLNLILIDFGLSFSEGSAEDKGVDLYVLERALLSTHPNSESMFATIISSYTATLKENAKTKEILDKFEEIRMRGRKRTMVG